jgi:hypothetical protein
MNSFKSLKTGAVRSIKSWKGILIIWIFFLMLVSLPAVSVKSAFVAALGSSMITEKLSHGINIDIITDLGPNLRTIFASFSAGFILIILFGFLLNAFLTGGIFNCLRSSSGKFISSDFFWGSGRNFWSFLVIILIVALLITFLSLIIIAIPLLIIATSVTASESAVFKTSLITGFIFLIILPVFLLTADYARAWQATEDTPSPLRAIGKGFMQTFKNFFPSYTAMALVMIIQALFVLLALKTIPLKSPGTAKEIFMLFILSQTFFIIKIFLRIWRYGIVTDMFEQNIAPVSENYSNTTGVFDLS